MVSYYFIKKLIGVDLRKIIFSFYFIISNKICIMNLRQKYSINCDNFFNYISLKKFSEKFFIIKENTKFLQK